MNKRKKHMLLNLIVPGWLHLYFHEYLYFTAVFGVSMLCLAVVFRDVYGSYTILKQNILAGNPPDLRVIPFVRIMVCFVIMNIVYAISLRYLIKKLENEAE